MKKILSGTVALLMCASLAGCAAVSADGIQTVSCAAEPTVSYASEPAVTYVSEPASADNEAVGASGYFDYALFKETVSGENTVISPMSVRLALNMAALGARNDTERELLDLLGYENAEQMRENSGDLLAELNREDGSITVNNSVWVDKDYRIGEKYNADLSDIFSAESFREKLSGRNIVKKLNGWAEEKTKGLIPQLITQPFGDETTLLLVNALYFKNEWSQEFEPNGEMTFSGVNGVSTAASMITEGEYIYYGEGSLFRSVRLYYKDGSYMNVYLPKSEDEDVLDIIGRLTPEELAKAMDPLDILYSNGMKDDRPVRVVMPKFECEYNDSLKETLQRLGMTASFSNRADFGGMLDMDTYTGLYISGVIHAAKLECNEKGTEAAAVTMVATEECAAVEVNPPIEFIVDRPFIYEIKAPSGETLFIGTICGF